MIIGAAAAALFWYILFDLQAVNFWWGMTSASGILAVWSVFFAGNKRREIFRLELFHIAAGLAFAAVLYVIFWLGDYFAKLLFDFASGQIESIYANREQLESWKIGLLLFFWIGPAEEIFWRGMVQRVLSDRFGANIGWIAGALLYGAVHLWAGNFILFMAALICGLFWGWIYKKFGSLWPGIISHAVWDVIIFLIIPI